MTEQKIISKTISNSKTLAHQLTNEGIIYNIRYKFDLHGETVTVPKNCTLWFKPGGSISNGTIIGQNSRIIADEKVFDNISINGTWNCTGNVGWWATGCETYNKDDNCYLKNHKDESKAIQMALDSTFQELIFPPVPFYVADTLVLKNAKKIVMQGGSLMCALGNYQPNINGACIIFTDKDIPLLRIAVKEGDKYAQNTVTIQGGNFDVSLCENYTSNCIEVLADDNEKIWGLFIDTNINGKFNTTTGVGININPTENKAMTGNRAFVTHVRINSSIQDFGIGVKASNYSEGWTSYNWCTDLVIDGLIKNCPLAVESNVEYTDVRATIQAGYYFDKRENGKPLIIYHGDKASVSSPIFDITLQSGDKYANQYALESTLPNAAVTYYGPFESFVRLSNKLNNKVICLK